MDASATVADDAFDSGRSSPVQIAPVAAQSVVAGSSIVTAPAPSGSTVTSHDRLLPGVRRLAVRTVPPVTSNASSRSVT